MRQKIFIVIGYSAFFIFAFLFSLYLTFNTSQVKTWLESKANEEGIKLTISSLDKYWLSGVSARDITLQTKSGNLIKIDRLKARVAIIPLLFGKRKIGFQVALYGGKLDGKIEQAKRGYKAEFKIQNVNLASMQAGNQGGFWIASKLSCNGNLNLFPKDNPKNWSGKIDAVLGPGAIPSFTYQGFQIPEIKLENAKLALELKNGSARINTFELSSPDFPIKGTGQMEIRMPIINSLIQLEAQLNPSRQFLDQIKMLEAMLPSDKKISYRGTLAGMIFGR